MNFNMKIPFPKIGVMSLAFRDRWLLVPSMVHLEGQGCGAVGGGGAEMRLHLSSSTVSGSDSPASYSPTSIKGRALQGEIEALIVKGAVELAPLSPGYNSRLFVVQKASGAWRPVIDLSALNKFFKQTKFRMESNQSVLHAVQRFNWMISIDLKDAYLQVPILPDSWKFLCFMVGDNIYQFRATSVYKGHGSRVGHAAQSRDSYAEFSRRLVSARPFPSGGDSGEGRSSFMLPTRNCGKSGKILSDSIPDSHISRDGLSKSVFEGFPDGETNRRSFETDRRISILQETKRRYLEMSTGPLVVSVSSSSCRTAENAILTTSASSELGLCGRGRPGSLELSDTIGPSVVVRRSTLSGGGVSSDSPTRPAFLVRRLGPGLGGPSFRPLCFGPVVSRGKTSFHQYPGTSSYQTGLTGISTSHRGPHSWDICGQHHGLSVCEKTGRNDLRVPEFQSSDSPSLVRVTQCHPSTSICDGVPQCSRGFVKPQKSSDRVQMDIGSGGSGRASPTVAGEHRSVCDFSELLDSSLFLTN